MDLIKSELRLAEKKMIEEVELKSRGKKLAKLTSDNVAIVEAMIRNDSAYIRSTDKNAKPIYYSRKGGTKYGGSSAYWMTALKKLLYTSNLKSISQCEYERIIKGAVEAVDRENSTHLNADGCGREEITKRIATLDKQEFLECLKNPDYKNMMLIKRISEKTNPGEPYSPRTNISFASKFCHYACFYLFENEQYQDNYSIYDKILVTVLPWYLEYYQIDGKEFNLGKYGDYRKAIDRIRDYSEEEISRNGFDHLLWYYHKGRLTDADFRGQIS